MSTRDSTPQDPYEPYPSTPPPASGPQQPGPAPEGATTPDERNWAMAAHLGSFLAAWFALGLLAPLAVLLVKGNGSPFVRRHAIESLNFQINALVYTVLFVLLLFVLIGMVLLPLYGLFYLIFVILGGVRASQGSEFRYPLTIRFIN